MAPAPVKKQKNKHTGLVVTCAILLLLGGGAGWFWWTIDTHMLSAVKADDSRLAGIILKCGADVNATHKGGRTLLMETAASGNKEMAELLLDAGADISAKGSKGGTAADIALQEGNLEMYILLLTKSATPHPKLRWPPVTQRARA